MSSSIILLSGERNVGKSTVCQKTAALAQARGYTCGGIISLKTPQDDVDVLDVQTGEKRRLTVEADANGAVIQGRFRFDPQTLAWGNDVLVRARACQLLLIDELGPLEIERGQGWHKASHALQRNNFALAIVVVRPELVAEAQLHLPISATTVFTVTVDNREQMPDTLVEALAAKIDPAQVG